MKAVFLKTAQAELDAAGDYFQAVAHQRRRQIGFVHNHLVVGEAARHVKLGPALYGHTLE